MTKAIKFTKMQGIGNDYVYINCFEESIDDPSSLARFVSDRHFGIGSDGLVLIMPSEKCNIRMRMFNADGSEAEMCGNASRCVGKYAYEHGLVGTKLFTLETGAGSKIIQLESSDGVITGATVDMGEPVLTPKDIPLTPEFFANPALINHTIYIDDKTYKITCVSMGNPHAVTFVDDLDALDLEKIGPEFENYPIFPKRTNTEFVRVVDKNHLEMRVWERGAGETLACGTGACAAAVASYITQDTESEVTITLKGGDLKINWTDNKHVLMTGPAVTVFEGVLYV